MPTFIIRVAWCGIAIVIGEAGVAGLGAPDALVKPGAEYAVYRRSWL